MTAFIYQCPTCDGAGETVINIDPADPASGDYAECSLCQGDGSVTLAQIEAHDQAEADRADDHAQVYEVPTRTLVPLPDTDVHPDVTLAADLTALYGPWEAAALLASEPPF